MKTIFTLILVALLLAGCDDEQPNEMQQGVNTVQQHRALLEEAADM